MLAYVVVPYVSIPEWSGRICALHQSVFQGINYYVPSQSLGDGSVASKYVESIDVMRQADWRRPGITNKSRDVRHVTRSGAFVPHIFGGLFLFVSPEVRKALSSLANIGFNKAVFEHLVDLPMPKLGDFSWYDRDDTEKYDFLPDNYLGSLPHVPEFEKKTVGYCEVLPANFDEIADQYSDIKYMVPDFGSYPDVSDVGTHAYKGKEKLSVSKNMLAKYPIVRTNDFVFRDDAFLKIAPFLDLDYYAIARLDLGD